MMPTAQKRTDDVRTPRQKRSQDRVDLILTTAKKIISEKGSAQLKMTKIAEVAGITPSSMYQYFPNKSEIISALWERQLLAFRDEMEQEVDQRPANKEELSELFESLVDRYYLMHRDDPVMRDVWMSVSVDKSLGDLSMQDTEHHALNLIAVSQHLFPLLLPEDLLRKYVMLLEFTTAAVRLAVNMPCDEGVRSMKAAKILLRGTWLTFDQTHAQNGDHL